MANYTLRFYDTSERNEIESSHTELNKIEIGINASEIGEQQNAGLIYLDISTAIKFSKELRRQIALAKENIESKKDNSDGEF